MWEVGSQHTSSDSTAEKPANNAEQSAAELVEPRAGTKGNAGQQSTCRAQNRESVSQELERIRTTARQRKEERFTSLLHHIDTDSAIADKVRRCYGASGEGVASFGR